LKYAESSANNQNAISYQLHLRVKSHQTTCYALAKWRWTKTAEQLFNWVHHNYLI